MATIRYLVRDVATAIAFYRDRLGFHEDQRFGPAMAIMRRGDLALWLAGPASSAARPMPDGGQPAPGGWNRFVIEVDDIDAIVAALRDAGCRFRSSVVSGPGGRQVLVEDPSGNPVEIFAPR
ncbi:VOC family protein [Roseomonas sp. AR75]|uniref:VOC family protein n=1 Tax=Roseomonas sp. AR75 TaxID=2562311 RepID=UPI0010C039C1|nr:VOC family protein [Roseomonas sp. AR75]